MNFIEYKAWRETVLETRDPLRLDCLNPFAAMAFTGKSQRIEEVAVETALDAWADVMGVSHLRGQAQATDGVRAALVSIMDAVAATDRDLWLPEDVYPFYWETALPRIGEGRIHRFKTLPRPDFIPAGQASPRAVLLITNPVSPLGRYLEPDEVEALLTWLQDGPERILLIDAVYAYQAGFHESTRRLHDTGQVFVLHSLSKAWLQRGLFGAVLPAEAAHDLSIDFRPPPPNSAGAAMSALVDHPGHPRLQQDLFLHEWERLRPRVEAMIGRRVKLASNGYLSPVPISVHDALENHNVLLAPASIFGSSNSGLSVASCLYEMAATYCAS